MPRPLTISEVARRLRRDRVTVRRRIGVLGLNFDIAMSTAQFRRLELSFTEQPTLPKGSLQ